MTYLQDNRFLAIALAVSVIAHGALLAVRFVAPPDVKIPPTDPTLEVILVNAKHANRPLKAQALAQADLEGGGNADQGRSKSPLPDLRKMESGDSIDASRRRIAELEQLQKNLLTQVKTTPYRATPVTEKNRTDPTLDGADLVESRKAIARMAAEIAQTIEDQNKRPRRTYITPSTQRAGYALYYKAFQRKVEEVGTLNFPQKNGRKQYGELVLSIPIFQDGTVYTKDGGIKVRTSSGNRALDEAAIAIVRRAAPFGKFPPNMLSNDRDDLWVIITRFKFTREQTLETKLDAGK